MSKIALRAARPGRDFRRFREYVREDLLDDDADEEGSLLLPLLLRLRSLGSEDELLLVLLRDECEGCEECELCEECDKDECEEVE